MARIIVESGIDKGMVFYLNEGKTTLGRSANNAVQIIDKRMSRHHVEFERRGAKVILFDLGSKNGTFLNNRKVTGSNVLTQSDRIRIGETVFLLEIDEEEDAKKASAVEIADPGWIQSAEKSQVMAAGAKPPSIKELKDSQFDQSGQPQSGMKDRQIQVLLSVTDAIRTIFDLDELLERIMDILCDGLDPDSGVILLNDEKTNQLYPVISRVAERDDSGAVSEWCDATEGIKVSRSIINQAMNDKVSVLMADRQDLRFQSSESVIMNRINAALCCPLINKEEILGVLYLDSSTKFTSFTTDQQELLTAIADQSAMAIANVKLHNKLVAQQKFEKEMEIARTIQTNLQPKNYPEFKNFETSGMSLAAKHVGGDYYDFIDLDDSSWGIAIADVSGKGVPAALLTTTVRSAMLAIASRQKLTPPEMMTALNEVTYRDSLNNMFVTMVYAIIDDEKRTVEFSNAGHAHPMIFYPDGRIVSLIKGGCFLGIDEQMEFESATEVMAPGAILVLYTDGVTDATNEEGQQFGIERLKTLIYDNTDKSAREIMDTVYQSTLTFRGAAEQFDDFTLIVCKCIQ